MIVEKTRWLLASMAASTASGGLFLLGGIYMMWDGWLEGV
jgi:hypothetical protein